MIYKKWNCHKNIQNWFESIIENLRRVKNHCRVLIMQYMPHNTQWMTHDGQHTTLHSSQFKTHSVHRTTHTAHHTTRNTTRHKLLLVYLSSLYATNVNDVNWKTKTINKQIKKENIIILLTMHPNVVLNTNNKNNNEITISMRIRMKLIYISEVHNCTL